MSDVKYYKLRRLIKLHNTTLSAHVKPGYLTMGEHDKMAGELNKSLGETMNKRYKG